MVVRISDKKNYGKVTKLLVTPIIIINVFRKFLSDTHVRYPIIKDIIFPVTSILFKTIERHKLHKTTIQLF